MEAAEPAIARQAHNVVEWNVTVYSLQKHDRGVSTLGRTLQFEQHLFAYNRSANVFMPTQLMKHVII